MKVEQAREYHDDLSTLKKIAGNKAEWHQFLVSERNTPEYIEARETIRNHLLDRGVGDRHRQPLRLEGLDAESSSEPSIYSPIDRLREISEHRELITEEEHSLWAYEVAQDFEEVKEDAPGNKKKRNKLLKKIALALLDEPERLHVSEPIWSSLEDETNSKGESTSLVGLLSERVSSESKKRWKKSSVSGLGDALSAATHSESSIAQALLNGYFRGPDNIHDSVDALYNYALTLVSFGDDMATLRYGSEISAFIHDDVLNSSNQIIQHLFAASTCSFHDDILFSKALSVENVFMFLQKHCGIDYVSAVEKIKKESETDSFVRISNIQRNKALRKLGKEELERREHAYVSQLGEASSLKVDHVRAGDLDLDDNHFSKWPVSLLANDELMRQFNHKFGSRTKVAIYQQKILEAYNLSSDNKYFSYGFSIGDGVMVDLLVPSSLNNDRNKIFEIVGDDRAFNTAVSSFSEISSKVMSNHLMAASFISPIFIEYQGSKIAALVRCISEEDKNIHEVNALHLIGIPSPNLENAQIQEVSTEIAHDIATNNERTLNARGVRVIFDQDDLISLGYESVDFRKPRDQDYICVSLRAGGQVYDFRLDSNYNLDFEGKHLHSLSLQSNLHYLVLSALHPILCEKVDDQTESGMSEETLTVITRMGHYRLLPLGQHSTEYAALNCLEYDRKDLRVKNFLRREEQRRRGVHEDQIRNSTYVKPIESELEDEFDPLPIHLPRPIVFE